MEDTTRTKKKLLIKNPLKRLDMIETKLLYVFVHILAQSCNIQAKIVVNAY
jgi:hypothetical protein